MNTYLLSPSIHCQSLIIPHRWHLHCEFLPSGTWLERLLLKIVKHFFFKVKSPDGSRGRYLVPINMNP